MKCGLCEKKSVVRVPIGKQGKNLCMIHYNQYMNGGGITPPVEFMRASEL